jgi:hypothetical protein
MIFAAEFAPLSLAQSSTADAPETEYWREWWLIRMLAAKKEFKTFEKLEDKDTTTTLDSQPAQRQWMENWWKDKDPDWTTATNECRNMIDSLMQIADAKYRQSGRPSKYNPPWDERGQYFIKLGPPDVEERGSKKYNISIYDQDKVVRKMLEMYGQSSTDVEEQQRAETEAVIWTWLITFEGQAKSIRVQFQVGDDQNWIAVPITDLPPKFWAKTNPPGKRVPVPPSSRPGGSYGGITITQMSSWSDAVATLVESPAAEPESAFRKPIAAALERIRFRSQGDSTDLWMAYAIPLGELSSCEGERKARCTFVAEPSEVIIDDSSSAPNGDAARRVEYILRTRAGTAGSDDLAMQVQRFVLPSGTYRIGFRIEDLCDPSKGSVAKMTVQLVRYVDPVNQRRVSDVMLLSAPPAASTDRGSRLARDLNGETLHLSPLPSHVISGTLDSLRVYHEVYGIVAGADDSMRVRLVYMLYREKGGRVQHVDTLSLSDVSAATPALRFYRAFDLQQLRKGDYILGIETIDHQQLQDQPMIESRWTAVQFRVE